MVIKRLTDRAAALPNVGWLRKGGAKGTGDGGRGADLPYFRFTSEDPAALDRFRAAFGEEPAELPVVLAAETRDEAFEAWCEEFAAGGLKHRCDGERVVVALSEDGKHYLRYPLDEGPPCPGGCKPRGRLKVVVVGAGLRGTATVLTGSRHDLANISATLAFVEKVGGTVLGVPFLLRRVKRNISTPRDGAASGRARQDKWLIDLQPDPSWLDTAPALTASQRLELRAPPIPALPPAAADDDDEEEDDGPDWRAIANTPPAQDAKNGGSDVQGHRHAPAPGLGGEKGAGLAPPSHVGRMPTAPTPQQAGGDDPAVLGAAQAALAEVRDLNARLGLMVAVPGLDPSMADAELLAGVDKINADLVAALEHRGRELHRDDPTWRPRLNRPAEGAPRAAWREYRHALAEAIAAAGAPKGKAQRAATAQTPASPRASPPAHQGASKPADPDAASAAQVGHIYASAKKLGLGDDALKSAVLARFGAKDPTQLTRKQASDFIDELKEGGVVGAVAAGRSGPGLFDGAR